MMNRASTVAVALAAMITGPTTGWAQDKRPGTDAVLKARSVEKQVRVHKNGKEIRYALDGSTDKAGDKLEDGQVFVTGDVPIAVEN